MANSLNHPIRITVTVNADESEFLVGVSNKENVEKRSDYTAAMKVARALFLEAGGLSRAIIDDRAKHKAPPGVTYLPDGTIFIKPTVGQQ
jgi:hypothetical protein